MAVIIRMSVMSNLALPHCFRNGKVLHIVNCDRHNYNQVSKVGKNRGIPRGAYLVPI